MVTNHGIDRSNSTRDSKRFNYKNFSNNKNNSENHLKCCSSKFNMYCDLKANRASHASNLSSATVAVVNNRLSFNAESFAGRKFSTESRAISLEEKHKSSDVPGECCCENSAINSKKGLTKSKSTVSLSELDNIKKQTISNLKSFQFQTVHPKFKFTANLIRKMNAFCNREPFLERLIRKDGEANLGLLIFFFFFLEKNFFFVT